MPESEITYHKLIIADVISITKEFKLFVFADHPSIKYKAGQYLTLVNIDNGKEQRRSYSLTSSPELKERLTIGVSRVSNGFFSRKLIDYAKPGDSVFTTGAGGLFILPENLEDYKQVYCFAAGSGIIPCFSLIKAILTSHSQLSVVLIYSNSSAEIIIFKEELIELQTQYPLRFKTEFLYSNSRNLARARLHPDLLLEYISAHSSTDFKETLYYICGPLIYMDMCTITLQGSGVPKNNIRKENFVLEGSPVIKLTSPDKETRKVLVNYAGKKHVLEVHYPDSILQTAKKAGLNLPYSCESGRCGNCVAKCISGKVWLSYNEVLTDRELEKGLVLTCVGYPVYGDVEIEI